MNDDKSNLKKLELTDYGILRILSSDSRKSFREIGRELERSPTTIANHIDELLEKEIIKSFSVEIDYDKLGYDIVALIELTISKGKMLEVEKDIAKIPEVCSVFHTTGEQSAALICRFKESEDVHNFIRELNKKEYITRTNSNMILKEYKNSSFVEFA